MSSAQLARTSAVSVSSRRRPRAASDERREGELEGWGTGTNIPKVSKRRKPADAVAEKPLPPDGGLPLPRQQGPETGGAPVVMPSGNMGGAFKF